MNENDELQKLREALRKLNAPRPPRPSIAHLPLGLVLEAMTSEDPLASLGGVVDADAAIQKAKKGTE